MKIEDIVEKGEYLSGEFFISTLPHPEERPRMGQNGVYIPTKTREIKDLVRSVTVDRLIDIFGKTVSDDDGNEIPLLGSPNSMFPITGMFYLDVTVFLPPPQNWFPGMFPKRGDLDNYIKSIKDGMQGVLYPDDNLVYEETCRKEFGCNPGYLVKFKVVEFPKKEKKEGETRGRKRKSKETPAETVPQQE